MDAFISEPVVSCSNIFLVPLRSKKFDANAMETLGRGEEKASPTMEASRITELPYGLYYIPDIITAEVETTLLSKVGQ